MSAMNASYGLDVPAASAQARGKRILFIGLSYYSYTGRMVESLRKKGFDVKYYPSEIRSFWSKTVRKFLPSIYKSRLGKYHARIVAEERTCRYDYVFFLQIHNLAVDLVESLRESQPAARFILYNWDSLATHDYRPYLRFLDSVFTFDRVDAEKVGARYLPLFALPEYFDSPHREAPPHDIYFVGTVVTVERFAALRKLDDYCRDQNIRFAKHLHCSPEVLLQLLRRGLYMRGLTLRSLSTGEIIELMNDSAAVFDFPNHLQSGFTMRLIENMCAGKKIVTSNPLVRGEAFYTKEQFFVAEHLDFAGLKSFLRNEPQRSGDLRGAAGHAGFSLDNWLERIFEE
jgi:hypothetical protein